MSLTLKRVQEENNKNSSDYGETKQKNLIEFTLL